MRAVIQRVSSAIVSVQKEIAMPVPTAPTATQNAGALPVGSSQMTELSTESVTDNGKEIIDVASTQIVQEVVGEIADGLLVLLGVGRGDTDTDVAYLVDRTVNLRIFNDDNDQMNLSLLDVKGSVMVVSQFTLYGDVRKGRRPSYFEAMDPNEANGFYLSFCQQLRDKGIQVETGRFGAHMRVSLINDGPVTILLDSRKGF